MLNPGKISSTRDRRRALAESPAATPEKSKGQNRESPFSLPTREGAVAVRRFWRRANLVQISHEPSHREPGSSRRVDRPPSAIGGSPSRLRSPPPQRAAGPSGRCRLLQPPTPSPPLRRPTNQEKKVAPAFHEASSIRERTAEIEGEYSSPLRWERLNDVPEQKRINRRSPFDAPVTRSRQFRSRFMQVRNREWTRRDANSE
jgi:hypothetical protein